MHEKSTSLKEFILRSNFVADLSVRNEATALEQSVNKLQLGISEIQERMTTLKIALSSRVVIPPILSTDNEISLAFLIAVKGPKIDWAFAESILERYLFLATENLDTYDDSDLDIDKDADSFDSNFCGYVWNDNDFDGNIVTLLNGGDCWRVSKSLELLADIANDESDLTVGIELFDALASIILQPLAELSDFEGEETNWVYLIHKNQVKTIDHGILRWINSFLYSRKEKCAIVVNAVRLIHTLFNDEYCESLMSTMNADPWIDISKINNTLKIISFMCCKKEHIPRFITAGLLMAFMTFFGQLKIHNCMM
jgi:hypothetical protein